MKAEFMKRDVHLAGVLAFQAERARRGLTPLLEQEIKEAASSGTRRVVVAASGAAMVFEVRPGGYHAEHFSARDDQARGALLEFLEKRVADSDRRKAVSVTVADGDWEGIRFLQSRGMKPRLQASKSGADTWLLAR